MSTTVFSNYRIALGVNTYYEVTIICHIYIWISSLQWLGQVFFVIMLILDYAWLCFILDYSTYEIINV
jgi:hypothetical protein